MGYTENPLRTTNTPELHQSLAQRHVAYGNQALRTRLVAIEFRHGKGLEVTPIRALPKSAVFLRATPQG